MEEGESRTVKDVPTSGNQTTPTSKPTSNGKPAGSVEKGSSPTEHGGGKSGTGEGFAGIAAKMLNSKVKGRGSSKPKNFGRRNSKHNGCDDDLPLGSEAYSLGMDEHAVGFDGKYALPEDNRSKWVRTASQGIMGWQSFNSDVSNQTSASSASLEQLLNDRQVDPEEMLLSLGFGGEPQSLMPTLARVPDRFLQHASRAYGIVPPSLNEEFEEDVGDEIDAAVPLPDRANAAVTATLAAPPLKRRPGIWTLARTLSLLRLRTTPSRGHVSPSSNSSGVQPQANQPISILHPANQRYLASRGFYEKQGWPKGSFAEPEEDSLHAVKEEAESKDAASKRKMFQKTRSRRNWSMCDSGENEAFSGGGEWVTKSVDSQSHEDITGQDDSLGRGTYFSTTTESSTDSLDTPNLETERAFENIRREFNESRRREQSSSDDLFLPIRKKRLSSDVTDNSVNIDSDLGLDLLNTHITNTNYFVSPASSRQTTVEKAPTISDQSLSIHLPDDGDNESKKRDDALGQGQLTAHASGVVGKRGHVDQTDDDGSGDVRIIISSSDNNNGKYRSYLTNREDRNSKSSKLTVDSVQRVSSDSGSSSSATAVGTGSCITLATEGTEPRHLSESENSITDWDSISRTNSPHSFSHGSATAKQMVSNSCQTTDNDFNMAAAAAANQNVNVTTLTTSNRSLLHVHINKSGIISPLQDKRKTEYGYIEQSPRVQLSTFPSTISHLELMKRLQHSQNDLSRMGSVQSDSSGFGDTDPALESALPEPGTVKLSSLGSSMESCRTFASSATTAVMSGPHREEIATQTSLDSGRIQSSRDFMVEAREDSGHVKQSPKPDEQGHHYVTMCYIPTLTSRFGQSDSLRHRGGPASDIDHFVSYQDGAPVAFPIWRSRSGSDPRQPGFINSDDFGYTRAWPSTDAEDVRYVSPGLHPLSNRYGSQCHHLGRSRYETSGSNLVYVYPRRSSNNSDGQKTIDSHRQPENHSGSDWNSRPWVKHLERDLDRSHRMFTSQIDLYTNAGCFSRKEVPSDSQVSFRRHSDEGILDGRNNTPLSIELALARGSVSPRSLSATARTKTEATSANTTTTTSSFHNSSSNNNTTRSIGSVIHDSVATPSHYKTEAGFHFSPIAGNISGLHSDFRIKPSINSNIKTTRSTSRQRSCDILEDDFGDGDPITAPSSRQSDDFDTCSPVAEDSSDLSMLSSSEGHTQAGVLESRKLARLVNQPIHFKGTRRCGSQYRPNHLFKDWSLLSKRKILQEENRLLQSAIQKYNTELTIMEASFMVDYQTVYPDMTDQEREEVEELEWLWGQVKSQVLEMEHLLMARVKAVHAGNEFYSLMSNLGITTRMVELVKEQICQQQMASVHTDEGRDRSLDDYVDMFDDEISYHDGRHSSFQPSQSWVAGMGHMSTPRPVRRFQSSSTSSLPHDLNISLEQMKSSVLSQVKNEIKESTKKLEQDLQEKDREIKQLQEQLISRTRNLSDPQPRRWAPRSSVSRSQKTTRSRLHTSAERTSQETDV